MDNYSVCFFISTRCTSRVKLSLPLCFRYVWIISRKHLHVFLLFLSQIKNICNFETEEKMENIPNVFFIQPYSLHAAWRARSIDLVIQLVQWTKLMYFFRCSDETWLWCWHKVYLKMWMFCFFSKIDRLNNKMQCNTNGCMHVFRNNWIQKHM